MAAISAAQLLSQATALQQRLKHLEETIPDLEVPEQVQSIASAKNNEQTQLVDLQQKVELVYSTANNFDNFEKIAQKLTESRLSLATLTDMQSRISICNSYFERAKQAFQSKKKSEAEKLLQDIQVLIPRMGTQNRGISRAFGELFHKLSQAIKFDSYEELDGKYTAAVVEAKETAPQDPMSILVKGLRKELVKLFEQADYSSNVTVHQSFLQFFEKLRRTSQQYPEVKKINSDFFQIYSEVFGVLCDQQAAQKASENSKKIPAGDYEKMRESFQKVLKETETKAVIKPESIIHPTAVFQNALNLLKNQAPDVLASVETLFKDLYHHKTSHHFKMTESEPTPIAGRPCFHLYQIHKNGKVSTFKEGVKNYGFYAFFNKEGFTATNAERSEAINRTIIELNLDDLEKDLSYTNVAHVQQIRHNLKTEWKI
jgi:hypothetical protein